MYFAFTTCPLQTEESIGVEIQVTEQCLAINILTGLSVVRSVLSYIEPY